MTQSDPTAFGPRGDKHSVETGLDFQPKFDATGLIPAIVTEVGTGTVLMIAYMNVIALKQTLATGEVHFWSRARDKMWKKGEDSGNVLSVAEILTDCDQDALLIHARVKGKGVACHTGAKSCFYRRLVSAPSTPGGQALDFIAAQHPPDRPK
jgi:phosphoribosyl-AMP cyclohydrolase